MSKWKHKKEKYRKEAPKETFVVGKLSVSAGGLGFVTPGDGTQDIFIPPRFLSDAIDGDIVKISLLREQRPNMKGPAGRVAEIVERSRKTVVGELIAGKMVRPLSKKLQGDISITGNIKNARKGDWVEIELQPHDEKHTTREHRGTLKSTIGQAGTVEFDIAAVIKEYGLCPPYSAEDWDKAGQIMPIGVDREDLKDLVTMTIDPPDAKDFDDAISIRPGKNKNEMELGVHIADVAAWILHGSEWDAKAKKRSFTSYIPGHTLPMLPKDITQTMSLTPGKTSFCHSVLFTVDKNTGKILHSRRLHSRVVIAKRNTFDEVQDFIDGKPCSWEPRIVEHMKMLVELTRKMRHYRKETEHFLELATTEIRVLCDDVTKKIKGLRREIQTESDMLVEECMLAANVEVAKELVARNIPGIYRIHPEPSEEKLQEFSCFVAETFNMKTGDMGSRISCNHFLSKLPEDHRKQVIIDAFLRSLPRAFYHEKNQLHYGLGKGTYCHFTSPIRRYPDLLVHQQLWAVDYAGNLRSKDEVSMTALECSAKEQNNDEAYYAANDRLKLHYLKEKLKDTDIDCFEGVIRKISPAGLNIFIPDLGILSFIPSEYLGFTFKKRKSKFVASETHSKYKCGDFIYVMPEHIDLIKGSALFRPVVH
ncbi:MAG: ribonuclease R family protein [Victivallales bacterium]